MFIGTEDGCSVFDGKLFVSLSAKDSKSNDLHVMGFLEGEDYVCIYPYDHKPYYKYYPKTRKFIVVNDFYYLTHNTSTSPRIYADGDTIIGSIREGVNILHYGIKRSFKEMGQVFDIKPDQTGNLWIACWSENKFSKDMPGGLFKYDGKEVIRYSEKFGITDPTVWNLYYDTTFNILWVGTLNSGMYKIPLPAFTWYDKDDFGLQELNVTALLSDKDNNLWIGTKGFLLIRQPDGKIKICDNGFIKRIIGSYPLEYGCIKQDRVGNIYSCVYQSPLLKYSQVNNFSKPQIVRIKPAATQFTFDNQDTVFYSDRWWDGVFHCSISPKITDAVYWGFKDRNAPPDVIKMISTGDIIWYISQTEGLFRSYRGHIDYLRKNDSSLPRIINDICFDGRGNIIIGSNTGEIIIARYQENGLKIRYRLQPGKEIIGNTVKFLIVDKANHLFIGTNLGLNRIDLNTLNHENRVKSNFYDNEVGYYDYSGKVAGCDREGNIWVGTDSHLLKIDTKLLDKLSAGKPKIKIIGLEVNYQPDSNFNSDYVRNFSHSDNNLIFHFTATNYLNPNQTLYRYKLEGLADHWSEYSTEIKAVLTSLNYGKYRLIVEAYNRMDNSKTGSTIYSFHIRFPWYLNGWFITGTLVFLILSIYWIIRLRINQIKISEQTKSEFARQLSTIEMRGLQSQMNPHFIFNSINSIQGFILKNKVDDAIGYLQNFSKIIRQTLDNATKEYISLDEEIEYIKWYLNLELMRFDNKFKVEFRIHENLNPQNIQIPPMIIQPYVENAVRHGLFHKEDGEGLLLIDISIEGENLKCVIEDNGVGRKKSKEIDSWRDLQHKPQSTRITQERIDLLNKSTQSDKYRVTIKDICNRIGDVKGTQVEIILPLRTP
ncbi:MAG: histidine kinase [Bacteroidales bacterium]